MIEASPEYEQNVSGLLERDDLTVMVFGYEGRTHALAAWAKDSPHVEEVLIAPGNGGTGEVGINVEVDLADLDDMQSAVETFHPDLVIVQRDSLLSLGLVDRLQAIGVPTYGPSQSAFRIESRKDWSKALMKDRGVPTADYGSFDSAKLAHEAVEAMVFPLWVKGAGLGAGKAANRAETMAEAHRLIDELMVDQIYGAEAAVAAVLEQHLEGGEISTHAFVAGAVHKMWLSMQDYKTIGEGDTGKNTGGVGGIMPVPWFDMAATEKAGEQAIKPVLDGLDFLGVLYPGLMVTRDNGITVIEYNGRSGDPETQLARPLAQFDIIEVIRRSLVGDLESVELKWKQDQHSNLVVLTTPGYPGEVVDGQRITGIEQAKAIDGVTVFHAGTAEQDGEIYAQGGRNLNIVGVADKPEKAHALTLAAADKIRYDGQPAIFRTDIGKRPPYQ